MYECEIAAWLTIINIGTSIDFILKILRYLKWQTSLICISRSTLSIFKLY